MCVRAGRSGRKWCWEGGGPVTCTLCWGPSPQPPPPDLDTLRSCSLNCFLSIMGSGMWERDRGLQPHLWLVQPTSQGGNLPPAQQQLPEPPRNPEAGCSKPDGGRGLPGGSELC